MPIKIAMPNSRYKIPDTRLISIITRSLNFFPIYPAPITFPISASIFNPRQVEKMMIRSYKEYTDASEAAIMTQKEMIAGFKVLMIKPELRMAR